MIQSQESASKWTGGLEADTHGQKNWLQDKHCVLIYPKVRTSMLKWRQGDRFWARRLTQENYISLYLERLSTEQRSRRNHATRLVTAPVLFTRNLLLHDSSGLATYWASLEQQKRFVLSWEQRVWILGSLKWQFTRIRSFLLINLE